MKKEKDRERERKIREVSFKVKWSSRLIAHAQLFTSVGNLERHQKGNKPRRKEERKERRERNKGKKGEKGIKEKSKE